MNNEHNGEELFLVHVLPYRIVSNEYGDYPYVKEHDKGELTCSNLPGLAAKLRELAVNHALAWGEGRLSAWKGELVRGDYERHALQKFDYEDRWDRRGLTAMIGRAPENGLTYVELGDYRIELRQEHEEVPTLPTWRDGFEMIVPALKEALIAARGRMDQVMAADVEAQQRATIARKRAELAKLQAELGEKA